MAMYHFYREFWDECNPSLNDHVWIQSNQDLRDFNENHIIQAVMLDIKGSKEPAWATAQKVRVKVWLARDRQKIGDPIFDFTFKPDDYGHSDLK